MKTTKRHPDRRDAKRSVASRSPGTCLNNIAIGDSKSKAVKISDNPCKSVVNVFQKPARSMRTHNNKNMQNKPNFHDQSKTTNPCNQKTYAMDTTMKLRKNKPNSNPIKPNFTLVFRTKKPAKSMRIQLPNFPGPSQNVCCGLEIPAEKWYNKEFVK